MWIYIVSENNIHNLQKPIRQCRKIFVFCSVSLWVGDFSFREWFKENFKKKTKRRKKKISRRYQKIQKWFRDKTSTILCDTQNKTAKEKNLSIVKWNIVPNSLKNIEIMTIFMTGILLYWIDDYAWVVKW